MHGDEDSSGIRNDVSIGKEGVLANDESGASASAKFTRVPWGAVAGSLGGDFYADYGFVDV